MVESDKGTHFTGHGVQMWANQMDIQWKLHALYNPQGAVLWAVETAPMGNRGCEVGYIRLWDVLRGLKEQP